MTRTFRKFTLTTMVVAALVAGAVGAAPVAGGASGGITFDGSPGTAAPPATLGPFGMTAFGPDSTPNSTSVTSVEDPAGTITFDTPLTKTEVGSGWSTWSHGYTGPVYYTLDATTGVTVGLPDLTMAFYMYVEPNSFSTYSVVATAQDGTTSGPTDVTGNSGAKYFGFYGDPLNPLVSVTVTAAEGSEGFAIGEFGIASGFTGDITLTKVVEGQPASPTPFTVEVACTYGDPEFIPVPAEGGSVTVAVVSSYELVNTCTFTETDAAGATSVSYECAGELPDLPLAADVEAQAIPVCASSGPQATPISVNVLASDQTAEVTITNTYVVLEPRFTG